ncbi:MAG: response regulator, partial [Thermoanaerobaculia bacterium]
MTRTILLADDSVTIQKVVELTFLDEDFRVVAVGDGTEAVARLDEVRPDLVIADVHMPGAGGYEVAESVAKARPGTPVLLLVGTFEVFDGERAASAGAAGHLKKPFDSQELLRRVKDLLAGAPAS